MRCWQTCQRSSPRHQFQQTKRPITAQAEYATAVALTTGTFTPVPTEYVTPFVIPPSPPAENTVTAVARLAAATEAAAAGGPTATPLPYNAVVGEWVIATSTPQNVATAAAMAVAATANAQLLGPATATPFHWLVITPTPQPVEPEPTPTPTMAALILSKRVHTDADPNGDRVHPRSPARGIQESGVFPARHRPAGTVLVFITQFHRRPG